MKAAQGTATHVSTSEGARQLAQRITDPQRPHPFVVITKDDSGTSSFDADDIAAALRIHADVWVVSAGCTWDLNEGLGLHKVFGDAAAVYPPLAGNDLRNTVVLGTSRAADEAIVAAAREAAPGRTPRRPVVTRAAKETTGSTRPSGGLHFADTAAKVDALAHHLLDPTRDRPLAVVTIPSNRTKPWIDPQEIVTTVGSGAEVHLLETGPRTFQLTSHLNRMAGVYGGAGRVYDVGQEWLANPYLSPLRFAYDQVEGRRACADLINDLVGALARTGHLSTESSVTTKQVTGEVAGVVPPSRALVRLDDGELATIWAELVSPGLDIGAIVETGTAISGEYDPESRRVDIGGVLRSSSEVRAGLSAGVVIAASVKEITANEVVLVPYPGVTSTLSADAVTGNELDDLTELLSPGEVVPVRYLGPGLEAASWSLGMADVDDDEPVLPVALVPEGPSWLAVPAPAADQTGPEDVQPADETGDERLHQERLESALREAEQRLAELSAESVRSDDLARRNAELEIELRARDLEIDTMHREIRDAMRKVSSLERQLEHERTVRRRAVQKSNKSKGDEQREVLGFADPEQQLRWDIQRTWVESTRPEYKDEWRLPDGYAVGPDFCDSLQGVEGVSRDRVLHVLVRLLTGRGVPGDHPLRTNKSGNSPAVTRMVDGVEWLCRRAPLQQSTPSARRLSYWRDDSGRIALSRVAVHDDLTP
ncbi:hypothetical protein [Janibacter cremeus]|uniref:S1 motif domain-containing protein n=1 Tax=Janibacter cremeus TaxID=1285192 RepID=A0A852VN72_9MICO|nr:hypothetical protein [Janibacter cremeus]NYF96900.1 hypothetical protein [Janibacter cremeus]